MVSPVFSEPIVPIEVAAPVVRLIVYSEVVPMTQSAANAVWLPSASGGDIEAGDGLRIEAQRADAVRMPALALTLVIKLIAAGVDVENRVAAGGGEVVGVSNFGDAVGRVAADGHWRVGEGRARVHHHTQVLAVVADDAQLIDEVVHVDADARAGEARRTDVVSLGAAVILAFSVAAPLRGIDGVDVELTGDGVDLSRRRAARTAIDGENGR